MTPTNSNLLNSREINLVELETRFTQINGSHTLPRNPDGTICIEKLGRNIKVHEISA